MIDIEKLRRLHLGPSLTGTARKDNWPIGDASLLSAGTLRALLDELEALRAANQWLPMDGAPRDGTVIDIWCVNANPEFGGTRFENCRWRWKDTQVPRWVPDAWSDVVEDDGWVATHYRLLPHPPQD